MKNYSEDSIQILEGLDAVRKRPGMYIGSTDSRGLHHLAWEIIDNSIDEVLAGHGDKIIVTIHKDGSVSVEDFGRGVPIGMHSSGKSTPEVIFTKLHAGGKFGGEESGYKTSGGLHGVGSSVVNALSSSLDVIIKREGKIYEINFHKGGSVNKPLREIGNTSKTGTKVTYKPDTDVFNTLNYSFTTICERVQQSAFLNKGLEIKVDDERKQETKVFKYDNGIKEYVEFLNKEKEIIHSSMGVSGEYSEIEVDCAFQYTNSYNEQLVSFVNNVRTSDGGTHETAVRSAFTKSVNDYAKVQGLLKEGAKNLEGGDVREGLSAIISIRIPEKLLQFEGQTKSKLGTPEARLAVETVLIDKLQYFLAENAMVSKKIVNKSIQAQNARLAARKAREEIREGKKKGNREKILSGKLTPAQSKDKKKIELYLVEGDSAGGSAKQGRDRKFQAILPLRGKVINTERAKMTDIFKNEEISTIIHTIGGGLGLDFDVSKVKYDKVIIMTDADTDGAHIQILLLTFFYRYMRELVEAGKVYIALPPLFKVSRGQGSKEVIEYAWEEDDLQRAINKVGRGYTLQRYKGLGEMNADQLWETTMDPDGRTLIKVKADDAAEADRAVTVLMGDKVHTRREWIEENVKFTLEDSFQI